MRIALITLLAMASGFVTGLFLSKLIGVVGVLVFQQPWGIKYLPVYLAVISGVFVLWTELTRRKRAG